ncbi:MAG: Gldg family protein, partial [Alphaproteobacteria bacterium]|nr:Gldg family protein [Alphaproteobacteria bacterium]
MKLQTQQINKLKKHAYLISFILIIIISFIALNAASGLIFSTYKLDLTRDKRYTLHPQTTQILQNIPHPITINVYYSSSISKDYPLYSQYAQLIMRTLDKYQNVSKNKIKVNMLDPVPYTSTEEDAIRYGLRKFSNQEG